MTISVTNLSKFYSIPSQEKKYFFPFLNPTYQTKKAVNNISFSIEEGELVGFIGPNGAGKTTTIKMLSGLLYPTSGTVQVLGFTPFERNHKYLRQIALVMGQKNQLWWDLPAKESFLLNKEIYCISDDQYKRSLAELVDLLDVSKFMNIQVRKLSLGERMKMEFIAALLHTPKVLFLDEPTIGLDVMMQKNVRDFIREYNLRNNSTILLTSHYMEDVRQLASRVIIIDHGVILYDGNLTTLTRKYTKDKLFSFTLVEKIPLEELEKLGVISMFEYPHVRLRVVSSKINSVATYLLDTLSITDLTIEERDIDDIIRDVFMNKL